MLGIGRDGSRNRLQGLALTMRLLEESTYHKNYGVLAQKFNGLSYHNNQEAISFTVDPYHGEVKLSSF